MGSLWMAETYCEVFYHQDLFGAFMFASCVQPDRMQCKHDGKASARTEDPEIM
jgi:hypothetical protein